MTKWIKQTLCGLFTHHDLVRDGGKYVCSFCLKKVEWFSPIYPISFVPVETQQLYEDLMEIEMKLCGGG